ncbi:uncharacterized protein LOC129216670 [Uloborus diversus]|uniref:uncharacterized protein LOC129216670 n=1 Tax=Uloborus diversus TaxID=327109 RepID=UPI00240A8E4F|nr:uncharacterized protein LOC129216670 [Uloborus diversus]
MGLTLFYAAFTEGCPSEYFEANPNTCLHLARPNLNGQDLYCSSKGGRVFSQPVTDDMIQNLASAMRAEAENWMPEKAYLGMYSISFQDPWTQYSDTWKYEGEEEEFDFRDYPLWFTNPSEDLECASVGQGSEFKANPVSCNEQMSLLCEKNEEPCDEEEMAYVDYDGHCLVLIAELKSYPFAKDSCNKGHLFRMKNESDVNRTFLAFYNTLYSGGVHIGLQKEEDGRWLYFDGTEEEEANFAEDNDNEFRCGVVRLLPDFSLGLYSVACYDHKMWFLCERSMTN